MHKMFLFLALSLAAGMAIAIPRIDCNGCATLREFGNFGAASLYRATGAAGPAVGSDQIWVDNHITGASVFVDVDTPINMHTIMGTEIPIPDVTRMEVNATWANGSGTGTWVLPNEVLGAIGASIESAENNGTPEVTPEEVVELPGLSADDVWRLYGWSSSSIGSGVLASGTWMFSVSNFGGSAQPVVTVFECAWSAGC